MNSVSLVGRLTKDPAVSTTKAGKSYVRFSLAVDRHIGKDKAQEGTPTADFISCVAWEKTAEVISQYTAKGRKIAVEGRIQTRSYDAKDGSKRYVTEVVVQHMEFCESKRETACGNAGSADMYPGTVVPDEDIPF